MLVHQLERWLVGVWWMLVWMELVTTSIGTGSTSGGARCSYITNVDVRTYLKVVDYNEARAGLVEIPEARNDIKPISQSISGGIV